MSHQLKEVLCARGVAAEWADNLPWVLLRLYAALKDESCVSTAVAALGQQLMKPGQAPVLHVEGLPAANMPPAIILRYLAVIYGGGLLIFPPGQRGLGVH